MQDILEHRHLRLVSGVLIAILVPATGIFSYVSANEGALARPSLVKIAQLAEPPAPAPAPAPASEPTQPVAPEQPIQPAPTEPNTQPAPAPAPGQPLPPPSDQNMAPQQPTQGMPAEGNLPPQGYPGGPGQYVAPGMPGQNMGPNNDNSMGPNNDNSEEMQKKNDERRKKDEERSLKQMKSGMKRAAKDLVRVKALFAKVTAKGIAIPAECSEGLAKAQETVAAVMNAADFEAVQEVDMNDLGDSMQTVNDCRPRIEMLSRLPQFLKQIDSQIKKIERSWITAKKGAPADAADAIADGDAAIAAIKEGRAKVETMAKAGEVDDLGSAVEEEVFVKFDDVGAIINRVMAAKNARRFLAQVPLQLKNAAKTVAQLKKMGKDTVEAEAVLAKARELYASVKAMKSGSEEYADAVDNLAQVGQEFAEAAGVTEDADVMLNAPGKNQMGSMPNLQMPNIQGMNFGGNNMGGPGQNMGGPGMAP